MSSLTAKIARGTFFLSFRGALSRCISFVTVIVVTHGLSLFEYGVVTLVLSVTGPVNSLSGLGMDELIVADTAKSLGERRRGYAKKLLLSFFRVRFLIIAALAAIGWLFRQPLENRYGPAISEYFLLLALLIFAQYLRNAFNLIFQIHQKFGSLSLLGIVEVAARFAAVIIFWQLSALTVHTVLLSYVIATAVSILIAVPQVIRTLAYFREAPREPGGVIWPILTRHGKWQMGLDIASSMISNVKYWLIKIFLSTEAVAVFSVAQSMYSAVASLLPLKSVMFPIIAEHSGDIPTMRQLVQRSTKYSLIFYFGLLIFSVLIAPPFIIIFFPKYLIGILIFQLMALRLPLNAFSISQAPLLIVLKEQRYLFFLSLVNTASMLLFLPLLMSTLGLPGVVIEWLITVLIVIVLREIFLRRKHQLASVSLKSFFTVDKYDKMVVRRLLSKLGLPGRLLSRRD